MNEHGVKSATLKGALNVRGRAATSNGSGRFEQYGYERHDDGWDIAEDETPLKTEVFEENARHIITKNTSPDVPFDRSINAYRGCEHGCIYCFARPTHTYMGLSAGLDFESKLFAKPNAAELLEKEIAREGYEPKPIAMGTNTDPYQPIEREREITRSILEVLNKYNHPCTILTKSRLIVRDLDILAPMAEKGLVKAGLSVTTLDRKLSRTMEPRASMPQRRLDAIRLLSDAGVPTIAMFAPVIPALNDHEMEQVIAAVAHAGTKDVGYILMRLPLELTSLFEEWLDANFPNRKERVMNRLKAMRGGKTNDPRFKHRMTGKGAEADLMRVRFAALCRKHKLNKREDTFRLVTEAFQRPILKGSQYSLLDALK
ncbi:PA0069 family radical SAM protein [Kordiimonas laminariae]|uniref:PA0069 family radical SAM protein n=1 Tax=Kordiimonas laminariae TaxID=2917717 RepID=UPI001FF451EA|nr:PA0069 family radical SAM protein [Kordiimonas laminariae]MCK0068809.1 PA0069 family radical SAM protein [Kordiimonas laminariae]